MAAAGGAAGGGRNRIVKWVVCAVAAALGLSLVACDPQPAALGLAVSTPSHQVVVGEPIAYTFTVENTGTGSSNGTVFNQTLPDSVSLQSAVPSQGACSPSDNTVSCDLGPVPPDATATVVVTALAQQVGVTTTVGTVDEKITTAPDPKSAEAVVNVLAEAPTGALDDTFTRADADQLGTAESGQAWTAALGGWQVDDMAAAPSTPGYALATADGGSAVGSVSVDVPRVSGEFWLVLRASNSENYWRFGRGGGAGAYQLLAVVDDGPGPAGSTLNTVFAADGDRLHCLLTTASITCGVNGVPVATSNSPFNQSATGFGMAAFHPSAPSEARFDNIEFQHPQPIPLLSLGMTSSAGSATVGHAVTYTMTVTNNGDGAATAARLEDTVPANISVESIVPSQGACTAMGATFSCSLGAIAPAASATVLLSGTAESVGLATNTASVFNDHPSPALHDSASATVSVLPHTPPGPLTDTFTRPDSGSLGVAETGQLWTAPVGAWGVAGEQAAPGNPGYNLALADTGAPFGTFQATVPTTSDEFWLVVRASSGENYWRFGRAGGGDYRLERIVGNGHGATDATTLATVMPTPGDVVSCTTSAAVLECSVNGTPVVTTTNAFNNTATSVGFASFGSTDVRFDDASFVEPDPAPLLELSMSPSADPVTVGDPVSYTVEVRNAGDLEASAVRVDHTFASQLAIDSVVPSQGNCTTDAGTVSCQLGPIAPDGVATITIATTTADTGVITSSATVHLDGPQPELHDSASSTILVLPADLGNEVLDTFARPDAPFLGLADTGHPWTADLGSWAVNQGRAVHTSTGYGMATFDAGAAFGYYDVVIADPAEEFWIVFHQTDAENYWRFGRIGDGDYVLHRIENGQLGTGGFHLIFGTASPAPGDFIRVRLLSDDSIDVFVNGQHIVGTGSFFNIDATRFGMSSYRGTTSWPSARFELVRFTPFTDEFPEPPHD